MTLEDPGLDSGASGPSRLQVESHIDQCRKLVREPFQRFDDPTRMQNALRTLAASPETPTDLWRDMVGFAANFQRDFGGTQVGRSCERTAATLLLKSPNGVHDFVVTLLDTAQREGVGAPEIKGGVQILGNLMDTWAGRDALSEVREELSNLGPFQRSGIDSILGGIRGADRSEQYGAIEDLVARSIERTDPYSHPEIDEPLGKLLRETRDLSGLRTETLRFLLTNEKGGWPVAVLSGLKAASIETLRELAPALTQAREKYGAVPAVKPLLEDLEAALARPD